MLALFVHAELLVGVGLVLFFFAPRDADVAATLGKNDPSVEIGLASDEAAQRFADDFAREQDKADEAVRKKEEESPVAPGQVVELPRPRDEERPDKARFAAEHDATAVRETKKAGHFNPNAAQQPVAGEARETTPQTSTAPARTNRKADRVPGAGDGPLAMRTRADDNARRPPAEDLNMRGVDPIRAPAGQSPEPEPGAPVGRGSVLPLAPLGARARGGGGAPSEPGAPSLVPTQQQVARAIASGTDDYLKDVDDGAETALNAKKWVHAAFFNRVKRQVQDHWRPAEVYRQRDPNFRIYGQRDRFTLLRVALKPDGSLADVALETPSGVDFLDDEAIEAFKEAQPFPNPPHQLIGSSSGLISFRFGFYFEIGGAPRMKVFRYDQM